MAPTRRKSRQAAGNSRGTGTVTSFGWQKSVRRIARLVPREVARQPEDYRALARRNLVASPDVRHGRRDGEPVRGFKGHL